MRTNVIEDTILGNWLESMGGTCRSLDALESML